MQIGAQKDNQLLRDTVVWDVLQPYNSAQQYAAVVCECLGLRFDWYKIIVAAVDSLLADIWEVCSVCDNLQRLSVFRSWQRWCTMLCMVHKHHTWTRALLSLCQWFLST